MWSVHIGFGIIFASFGLLLLMFLALWETQQKIFNLPSVVPTIWDAQKNGAASPDFLYLIRCWFFSLFRTTQPTALANGGNSHCRSRT
jgi:hypothetical protein